MPFFLCFTFSPQYNNYKKMFSLRLLLILPLLFVFSCNNNMSEEEKKELWSKAQTRQAIIDRSGTMFNSATEPEVAMRDAQTRLQSGGGMLGKGGLSVDGILGGKKDSDQGNLVSSMNVNVFLWRGALETIDFMPLSSADQIGGTIITDWYSTDENYNERCKLNIFISGMELKTENLRVTSFCQELKNQTWINKKINKENNIKIENAILNRAKKQKLQSS